MNNSKTAVVISRVISIVQRVLGLFIAILFGIPFLVSVFDSEDDDIAVIITMLIFAIIGIVIFLFGLKRSKSVKLFKSYVSYISADPTGSIANLAASTGTSNDVVTKNLQYMINKKYFANAHINRETNCIIVGVQNKTEAAVTVDINARKESVQPQITYCSVKCRNCGGINKIPAGEVMECDFCGSPIRGE